MLLESTLALAAPAIVALLLADLVLGAIARMAPQIPVYFVGMPLKALAGVGIVLVGLGGIDGALSGAFRGWYVSSSGRSRSGAEGQGRHRPWRNRPAKRQKNRHTSG